MQFGLISIADDKDEIATADRTWCYMCSYSYPWKGTALGVVPTLEGAYRPQGGALPHPGAMVHKSEAIRVSNQTEKEKTERKYKIYSNGVPN